MDNWSSKGNPVPNDIVIALVTVTFLVIVFLWAYLMDRRYLRLRRQPLAAHIALRSAQRNVVLSELRARSLEERDGEEAHEKQL